MFQIDAKDFQAAVKLASVACDRRAIIPILSAMKARAGQKQDGGALTLEATNLDMTAIVTVPCESEGVHEFMIPDAASLVSAVNAAGGSDVAFAKYETEVEETHCDLNRKTKVVTVKKRGYTVTAGPLQRTTVVHHVPDDFPSAVQVNDRAFTATLTADMLAEIARVKPAISTEETRYYLNGISMKAMQTDHDGGWSYRFAATDGHRLMVVDVPMPDAVGDLGDNVIMPTKFLNAAFAHFKKAGGPIGFTVGNHAAPNHEASTAPETRRAGNHSRVGLDATIGKAAVTLTSKLIDGTYPDVGRVIPKAPTAHALFEIPELRRAILAVKAGSDDKVKCVALTFNSEGAVAKMKFAPTGVTSEFVIGCQHDCPDGFTIGFNANYALDILNALRGSEVSFGFGEKSEGKPDPQLMASAPMLVRGTADDTLFAVLMPMRF